MLPGLDRRNDPLLRPLPFLAAKMRDAFVRVVMRPLVDTGNPYFCHVNPFLVEVQTLRECLEFVVANGFRQPIEVLIVYAKRNYKMVWGRKRQNACLAIACAFDLPILNGVNQSEGCVVK